MSEDQARLQADLERLQECFPSLRPPLPRLPTLRQILPDSVLQPGRPYLCRRSGYWKVCIAIALYALSWDGENVSSQSLGAVFEIVEAAA